MFSLSLHHQYCQFIYATYLAGLSKFHCKSDAPITMQTWPKVFLNWVMLFSRRVYNLLYNWRFSSSENQSLIIFYFYKCWSKSWLSLSHYQVVWQSTKYHYSFRYIPNEKPSHEGCYESFFLCHFCKTCSQLNGKDNHLIESELFSFVRRTQRYSGLGLD